MNELSSLGLILLLALGAGHLVKFARVPEVTGYLLAGVALGPSVLGWVTEKNLSTLEILSEVALGLILFSVGTVFEISLFRRIGRQVVILTLAESALAAILVTAGMLALGLPWPAACLLGSIAIETAPASTLMVIRETNSDGPLTDNLLGMIAVNNICSITCFSLVSVAIALTQGSDHPAGMLHTVYVSIYPLFWQLVGSAALGYLVGTLLSIWSAKVTESGETLILLGGSILISVGVAQALDLSPLIASMAVGATMVNLSPRGQPFLRTLSRTDPPFYAIFFVLAGASLDLALVPALGWAGATYLFGRAIGKLVGATLGARWLRLGATVRRFLGFGLLAHAGLAVGLVITTQRRFPEYAPVVTGIVLASIVVYEIVGPISARFALMRAGEARPHAGEALPI